LAIARTADWRLPIGIAGREALPAQDERRFGILLGDVDEPQPESLLVVHPDRLVRADQLRAPFHRGARDEVVKADDASADAVAPRARHVRARARQFVRRRETPRIPRQ
jgi:hypothetical protein